MSAMHQKNTKESPGVKKEAYNSFLNEEELKIVDFFGSRDWVVTRSEKLTLSENSRFRAILIKPLQQIQEAFNLVREVIVIFSSYDVLDARAIDAFDQLNIPNVRTEEICSILVSKDENVSAHLDIFLKSKKEARIVVPFSYRELLDNPNPELVVNRIRERFYTRDLFGIQEPLTQDRYFFGRQSIVYQLVNRHLTASNSGIFGLRKTGKTSILFGVQRTLDKKDAVSVFIDCLTLHMKTWNEALYAVIETARDACAVKKTAIHTIEDYDRESFASDYFNEDIERLFIENGKRSILLIFDEIENITFGTSASTNWKEGIYFIKFWQTIRSSYQKLSSRNVFTFLVAGTNPRCVEQSSINGTDNPIFSQFAAMYIPPFTFEETREMVERLGGYMGLTFKPEVITHLVEDYGGHPLLMRQVCSFIHAGMPSDRPIEVNKYIYEKNASRFQESESGFIKYAEMILDVLLRWYPDEYEMLKMLALRDYGEFNEFAKECPELVAHLLNYGIIERNSDGSFRFRIEVIQKHLGSLFEYNKKSLSQSERRAEISKRRNAAEKKLRKLVRFQLKATFGEDRAREKVCVEVYGKDASKYKYIDYKELFDPNKSKLFLRSLFSIIGKEYDNAFSNVFGVSKDVFSSHANLINYYRKPDAHAAEISDEDFESFRVSISWLEKVLAEYDD